MIHHLLHLLSLLLQEMEFLLGSLESLSQLLDVLTLDVKISLVSLLLLREVSNLTFTLEASLCAFALARALHHGLVSAHLGLSSLVLFFRFKLLN